MALGNILASIGMILGFLGFLCLPLWDLNELSYLADPAYPKGSGWIILAQLGIFSRPGILLMVAGGILYLIAKILPSKYWETEKDLIADVIARNREKKKLRNKK